MCIYGRKLGAEEVLEQLTNSMGPSAVKGKMGTHQWNVRVVDLTSNRFLVVS